MLEEHITTFSEGHITLKHEAFHDAGIGKKITMFLKFYPGIKKTQLDKDAGTLEIEYDAKRLHKEKVMELLAQGKSWLTST